MKHLILYDFAIHWFDFLSTLMEGTAPTRVYASATRAGAQTIAAPLLGQAAVEYPSAQASLVFDGHTHDGRLDRVYVVGESGAIASSGPDQDHQELELATDEGVSHPRLKGAWFPDGFHGTMGELLCAIEEKREPLHSARKNLSSLALCFAAVASSVRGEPVVPGSVRQLSG
jgi:predicted dehydrogenase